MRVAPLAEGHRLTGASQARAKRDGSKRRGPERRIARRDNRLGNYRTEHAQCQYRINGNGRVQGCGRMCGSTLHQAPERRGARTGFVGLRHVMIRRADAIMSYGLTHGFMTRVSCMGESRQAQRDHREHEHQNEKSPQHEFLYSTPSRRCQRRYIGSTKLQHPNT